MRWRAAFFFLLFASVNGGNWPHRRGPASDKAKKKRKKPAAGDAKRSIKPEIIQQKRRWPQRRADAAPVDQGAFLVDRADRALVEAEVLRRLVEGEPAVAVVVVEVDDALDPDQVDGLKREAEPAPGLGRQPRAGVRAPGGEVGVGAGDLVEREVAAAVGVEAGERALDADRGRA